MSKKFFELQPNDEVAESADLSNLTPASIDLTSWQDLTIQDGEESIADKIANDDAHIKSDGVASAFAETTYAAGDFCTYDGKAYVCKLGYTATAASPDHGNDTTHWQLANLPTLFSSDNTLLMGVCRYPIYPIVTTSGATDYLKLKDSNVNTVTTATSLELIPPAAGSQARDLVVCATLSSSAGISFDDTDAGGDTVTYVAEDWDSIASEDGINIFSLTEVSTGVFMVARKLVAEEE